MMIKDHNDPAFYTDGRFHEKPRNSESSILYKNCAKRKSL